MSYPGFISKGFHIVEAFDTDPDIVGQNVGGLNVHPMAELDEIVAQQKVSIGIVAVPVSQAQVVVDRLMECGVNAILNYAPIALQVWGRGRIRNIDPVLSLQSMTYYLVR